MSHPKPEEMQNKLWRCQEKIRGGVECKNTGCWHLHPHTHNIGCERLMFYNGCGSCGEVGFRTEAGGKKE